MPEVSTLSVLPPLPSRSSSCCVCAWATAPNAANKTVPNESFPIHSSLIERAAEDFISVPSTRRPFAHEAVAVGHPHLRQRLRVHDRVLADDAVQEEHIGAHRVDLVVAERERIGDRHRPPHVVEQRSRVRPVAADGAQRRPAFERTDAARERVGRLAGAFRAVAGLALFLVDLQALARAAAALRQTGAARRNADVPARDLLRAHGGAERRRLARRRLQACAGRERRGPDRDDDAAFTGKHFSRFRRRPPPSSRWSGCDRNWRASIAPATSCAPAAPALSRRWHGSAAPLPYPSIPRAAESAPGPSGALRQ